MINCEMQGPIFQMSHKGAVGGGCDIRWVYIIRIFMFNRGRPKRTRNTWWMGRVQSGEATKRDETRCRHCILGQEFLPLVWPHFQELQQGPLGFNFFCLKCLHCSKVFVLQSRKLMVSPTLIMRTRAVGSALKKVLGWTPKQENNDLQFCCFLDFAVDEENKVLPAVMFHMA